MKTGLLNEDEEFAFVPLNLDERYQDWGEPRFDLIVQKLQSIVPVYQEEASQQKIWELTKYTVENNIPIIDSPENAMVVQNRLLFLRNLNSAVNHLRMTRPDDANA